MILTIFEFMVAKYTQYSPQKNKSSLLAHAAAFSNPT
jgi:hypothetical protein